MTDWSEALNLLCVRLDSIGDLLMTSPAIRALKEAVPHRRITLLTSTSAADIGRYIPDIDDIIEYEAPWMKATGALTDSSRERAVVELLHESRFDGAVIFTVYTQSPLPAAVMCWHAEIPLRLAHCHENPYQLLTHWVPDPEPSLTIRHEVRRQLDLVAMIGALTPNERLSLSIDTDSRKNAALHLRDIGIDTTLPWVVLHPGATAPSRRYPAESFAEVATELAAHEDMQVLFTGSAAEHELVQFIRECMHAPSWSLAGGLSLQELCGVLSMAPLLISNNTGPVHIAAALGTPVVDLYALTNPQHSPWQVRSRVLYHDVPCKFCFKSVCPERHHNCLRLVTPAEVVQAALEVLEG